jgi:CRP-like cAMP-binding protein
MPQSSFAQSLQSFANRAGVVLPNLDAITAATRIIELKPREFAFHENQPHPFAYLVRSGLLKQFYVAPDGNEWIKSFTAEGDLFGCVFALMKRSPTTFASVAIEPCVLEQIDFRLVERLATRSIEWQMLIRLGFEELAFIKLKRERDLLTMSAEAMYREFVHARPGLADRVPQKDLAGYLGVTPVGLNRIIKRSRATARSS